MSYDADGAQRLLEEGLKPQRPHSFSQADTLVRTLNFIPLADLTKSR